MDVSLIGMVGLYGGMLCGILGWWFGRRKAREQRGLDELYDHIWQKARSYAWYVTLVSIYIFFSLVMFGIDLSVSMVLGILLLVHLGSWAIIGIILSIVMKSSKPLQHTRALIGISIIVLSMVAFTITSVVLVDWRYMLIGIPISLIGLLYAKTSIKLI